MTGRDHGAQQGGTLGRVRPSQSPCRGIRNAKTKAVSRRAPNVTSDLRGSDAELDMRRFPSGFDSGGSGGATGNPVR